MAATFKGRVVVTVEGLEIALISVNLSCIAADSMISASSSSSFWIVLQISLSNCCSIVARSVNCSTALVRIAVCLSFGVEDGVNFLKEAH